jgi:hypothetical protein
VKGGKVDWDDYYYDDDNSYALRDFAKRSYSDDPYDLDHRNEYTDFGFDSYEDMDDSDEDW